MTFDALSGLFLLGALATALAVAATLRQKSIAHLADPRAANSLAEQTLLHLQSTGQLIDDSSASISLAHSGQRVGKQEWVEVTVLQNGRRASITGLAPATQPEGGKMSIRRSHHGRAFTITEMLFVLMIVSVAGVIAMRLFATSIRVIGTAPNVETHHASIDRLSEMLRRDVWSAKSIDLPDDRTIVLSEADSTKVRWTFSDTQATRADSIGERHWPADIPLHAECRDNALVMIVLMTEMSFVF